MKAYGGFTDTVRGVFIIKNSNLISIKPKGIKRKRTNGVIRGQFGFIRLIEGYTPEYGLSPSENF